MAQPEKAAHLAPYRWKPGQSGNTRGTSQPGIVRRIRSQTRDGRELVDRLLLFARGEPIGFREADDGRKIPVFPPPRDQREALIWLAERLAGKPKQVVEMERDPGPGFIIALRNKLGSVDPMAKVADAEEAQPPDDRPALPSARPVRPAPRPTGGVGMIWDDDGDGGAER